MKNLVVLSIYDSGYGGTFMENGECIYVDSDHYKNQKKFEKRFGKLPYLITIEELSKHYSSDYVIVICEDGYIDYTKGSKE